MSKINHSKLNSKMRAKKLVSSAKSKSISKRRLKFSKDLATEAQKKYMRDLGIDFSDSTTLRQAIELIRAKKKELEDATIPTIGI